MVTATLQHIEIKHLGDLLMFVHGLHNINYVLYMFILAEEYPS